MQSSTRTDVLRPAPAQPGEGAWFVLTVLCLVYVLNFLDRQLLSILAKPIQDELAVSDGQLGLIGGLYFAAFYCILAIPVGWLADRTNRVRVLAVACGLWSAATAACGFAATYPQLAVARMAVGIGEAGGVPPSYAIISDYFPSGKRGTALSIFNLGPAFGQALGIAFGASVAAAYSWRLAFVSIGAVGFVMALVVWLLVQEPKRGGLDAPPSDADAGEGAGAKPAASGFWTTCKMFFTHPVLLRVALAGAATQFVTYAIFNFTTLFLMREKGMTLEEVAVYYALLIAIFLSAGMYFSGLLIDAFAKRSKLAFAWIPAIGLVLAAPLFVGFVWSPTWQMALAFLAPTTCLNYFFLSPTIALVQEEVRPDQRVMSGALLLLVMNLVGLGFGPTFIGFVSDFFRPDYPGHSLQIAFFGLVPFYVLAVVLYMSLARALKREGLARGGKIGEK